MSAMRQGRNLNIVLLGYVFILGLLEACRRLTLKRKRKICSMEKITMIQIIVEVMEMERKSHILKLFGRQNL